MKKTIHQIPTIAIAGFLLFSFRGAAQTVQYVTLGLNNEAKNVAVQTNQIITLVGYDWQLRPTVLGYPPDGILVNITPFTLGNSNVTCQMPLTITGLTNITLQTAQSSTFATFKITTPATANVVSNYVPADAIVIPASATGNVQIILESSSDLVNWTAADPGTYGASSATNRFFRVRAICD